MRHNREEQVNYKASYLESEEMPYEQIQSVCGKTDRIIGTNRIYLPGI
jgi:hypothetical protein